MPAPIDWTSDRDALIRDSRLIGESWGTLATRLGISQTAARLRGHAIGAEARRAVVPTVRLDDPDREPLPPYHEVSWTVLTEGTLLAGSIPPWPPLP